MRPGFRMTRQTQNNGSENRLANATEAASPLDQIHHPRHNRPHENDDFHLWEDYPLAFALVRPFSSLEKP